MIMKSWLPSWLSSSGGGVGVPHYNFARGEVEAPHCTFAGMDGGGGGATVVYGLD